jgi:hypothetical protein
MVVIPTVVGVSCAGACLFSFPVQIPAILGSLGLRECGSAPIAESSNPVLLQMKRLARVQFRVLVDGGPPWRPYN